MKLLVTYSSGQTYTFENVEKIEKSQSPGEIYVEGSGPNTFYASLLEKETKGAKHQIVKLEIIF
jgi:hypothetical protein